MIDNYATNWFCTQVHEETSPSNFANCKSINNIFFIPLTMKSTICWTFYHSMIFFKFCSLQVLHRNSNTSYINFLCCFNVEEAFIWRRNERKWMLNPFKAFCKWNVIAQLFDIFPLVMQCANFVQKTWAVLICEGGKSWMYMRNEESYAMQSNERKLSAASIDENVFKQLKVFVYIWSWWWKSANSSSEREFIKKFKQNTFVWNC